MASGSIPETLFKAFKIIAILWLSYVALFLAIQLGLGLYYRLFGRRVPHPSPSKPAAERKPRETLHTAGLSGYPKAQQLIENIRFWILGSSHAQEYYLQVVHGFMQDLVERHGIPPDAIGEFTEEDVHKFFQDRFPIFVPASEQYREEGAAPAKGNKIWIQDVLLDAYEFDTAREEQWSHLLSTIVFHELAISLTKTLLPPVGGSADDFPGYAESGWHLEDLMFGGVLEIEWPIEREGHLDQIIRIVISETDENGERVSYDLTRQLTTAERGDTPLRRWGRSIQEALESAKRTILPKFQEFMEYHKIALRDPPVGWSRNRGKLTATGKPPKNPSWVKKRRSSSKDESMADPELVSVERDED